VLGGRIYILIILVMNLDIFNKDKIIELWETIHNEPIISLYLNTDHRVFDNEKRARITVKDFFKKIIWENEDNKDLVEKLKKYEEEVLEYLDTAWKYIKNGLVFFIGSEHDHFEVVELPRPVKSRIYFEKQAVVKPLLAYLDEFKKYLAVVMDKRRARVFVQYMGEIKEISDVVDNFWDQIEEKIHKDGKDEDGVITRYINKLSEHIMKLKEKIGFDRIVVFAPEKLKHLIEKESHDDFARDIVKVIPGIYTKLNINDIKNKVIEVGTEIEREEEQKDLEEILENLGNSDYKKGVSGLKNVLDHLNAKAVWKLILDEDKEYPGYIGKDSKMLYLNKEDATIDEELIEVSDLTNDMLEAAIDQDAKINLLKNNETLNKLDSAAAMVRFKI